MKNNKNIIIIILFGLLIFFIYKSYFSGDDSYKEDIELLKNKNKEIIKERDSLTVVFKELEQDFDSIKERELILDSIINNANKNIDNAKKEAYKSKKELSVLREKLNKSNKKIKNLINNPPNKSDSLLIESLKEKLKNVK